jgi:uncharacterized membrane protein YdjX (TVP38/TMEM64 family)
VTTKIRVLVIAGVIALAGGLYFAWPFLSDFTPERVERLVAEAGAFGPLVFIGLQVLQVLIAPIPGQVAGLAGGYLFGTVPGIAYTMVGSLIGFTLAFLLARKLGRRFVERHVRAETLRRFDFLTTRSGAFVLFLIFLLPAFPDDVMAFIAGLSAMRLRTFILVSIIGRLPGFVLLSTAGAGLAEENLNWILLGGGAMLVLVAVAYWRRDRLMSFLRRRGSGEQGGEVVVEVGAPGIQTPPDRDEVAITGKEASKALSRHEMELPPVGPPAKLGE